MQRSFCSRLRAGENGQPVGKETRRKWGRKSRGLSSAQTTRGSWLCYLQLGKKSGYSSMREQDYKPSGERRLRVQQGRRGQREWAGSWVEMGWDRRSKEEGRQG